MRGRWLIALVLPLALGVALVWSPAPEVESIQSPDSFSLPTEPRRTAPVKRSPVARPEGDVDDGSAAIRLCRLAALATSCRSGAAADASDERQDVAERADKDSIVVSLASLDLSGSGVCVEPLLEGKDVVRAWRAAAQAGNVAALRHYVSGNPFSIWSTLENVELLKRYKSEAIAMALAAASQGDLVMTLTLAEAYSKPISGPRSLLAQATGRDDGEALSLLLVADAALRARSDAEGELRAHVDGRVRQLEEMLSPERVLIAQQLAQSRIGTWELPPSSQIDVSLGAIRSTRLPDATLEGCERARTLTIEN